MIIALAAALVCTAVLLLMPSVAQSRLTAVIGAAPDRRARPRDLSRWVRARIQRDDRVDRALTRGVVQATDLLASLLASGLDTVTSMTAVAQSLPAPAGTTLAAVASALRLGATPAEAWTAVAPPQAWDQVAQAMVRSSRTGSPLAGVLAEAAEDLRRERLREVQVAARSAGVRAVGPLAACFLPGYLLLGVVPVVASLAGSVMRG